MGLLIGLAVTALIGLNVWASAWLAKRDDLEPLQRVLPTVVIWVLPLADALWVVIANARAAAPRSQGTPKDAGR
jgi:hypothetical protein